MSHFGGNRRQWLRPRPVPSRTSQSVASVRAQLDRPHTASGDPNAQMKMCRWMLPIRSMPMRAHIAARTQFFDGQVMAAIDRDVSQIVILGAGYDDRPLRFSSSGVHFFELDHPDTQADKRRRLANIKANTRGLTLTPIDFRRGAVSEVLAMHGHDADRASLFICEGLLVYLDQTTIIELLGGLHGRADPRQQVGRQLGSACRGVGIRHGAKARECEPPVRRFRALEDDPDAVRAHETLSRRQLDCRSLRRR